MPIHNLIYDSFPPVIHFPGLYCPWNPNSIHTLERLQKLRVLFELPENTTLVTWNSHSAIMRIEEQCSNAAVPLVVLGKGIADFNFGHKGVLLVEAAQHITSRYIIAVDSNDVSIHGDLSLCVKELERRNCSALFGGEANYSWGTEGHGEYRDIQDKLYRPPWRYLNAGLSVFRTEFLRGLVDVDWGYCDQTAWHRLHYALTPEIQVDDRCSVFQNIDQTTEPGSFRVVINIPPDRR